MSPPRRKPLATTITGSLPRPHWFTENLNGRPFLTAFNGDAVFREQYGDAVAALISDQTRAGLDIVTDGEMRFDRGYRRALVVRLCVRPDGRALAAGTYARAARVRATAVLRSAPAPRATF